MKQRRLTRVVAAKIGASTMALAAMFALPGMVSASASPAIDAAVTPPAANTPIQHLVVIYGENISFDHYFGTYPDATNPPGEPTFVAAAGTPEVNGLQPNSKNGQTNLLVDNPNGVDPQRLDPLNVNDVLTCDQNHNYGPEQAAFDGGKMDKFLSEVATGTGNDPAGQPCQADQDLDYYDGNTVTGMWNYAQHFALNDNSFGTVFGPSTPGALDVVSGDTGNVDLVVGPVNGQNVVTTASTSSTNTTGNSAVVPDGQGEFSDIGDTTPYYDDCPDASTAIALSGENVGDQLNTAGLSWGWFEGGFAPTTQAVVGGSTSATDDPGYVSPDVTNGYEAGDTPAACSATHNVGAAIGGTGTTGAKPYGTKSDYIAHHEPFQYYASTANPHHLAPTSLSVVGTDTESYTNGKPDFNTANHQYDISTFNNLLAAIDNGQLSPDHLPAVSYLKAPGYEDGHADYSDPLDEQQFVTTEINDLEQSPDWSSTAVVLAYDDSDGWYDHVDAATENGGQPQNASQDGQPASNTNGYDSLTGPGQCGTGSPVLTNTAGEVEQGRCGLGPRLPLLVISPYAKANHVDDTLTDQSSVVKFIEDNWDLGEIPGSAANVAGTLDNLFDFNLTPAKQQPALYLSPTSGQPEAEPPLPPAPQLPESSFPGALVGAGAVVLGAGAFWQYRRRRHAAAV
jgi:phospholipase C